MSIEKLIEAKKKLDDAQALYFKEAKVYFLDATKEFLETHKDTVKAIVWNQFTPYFNDGDPCVFTIYDVYFVKPEGFDEKDLCRAYDYEGDNSYSVYNVKPDEENSKLSKDIKIIDGIIHKNLSLMEEIFNDHVTVYLYLDENGNLVKETQDYDHD